MHKLLIKNHRGSTSIEYIDFKRDFLNNNLSSKYDLIIIDKYLIDINENLKFIISLNKNIIFLEAGESAKTLLSVFNLLKTIDDLKKYPINKCLLIGGASLQDCVATSMSLLKRGTSWDYIPTTLLSQTDSCIGSKTSINSENTKNLYGLFYPPEKVFIVHEFLNSLPTLEIVSGFGDALHYLLVDPNKNFDYAIKCLKLFNNLGPKKFIESKDELNMFFLNCHKIKKYYIERDEFDKRERKVLNLGHSFGHALESLFDFVIPHGIGVLFGINLAISFSLYLNQSNINKDINDQLLLIQKQIISILNVYSPIDAEKIHFLIKNQPEKFMNILSRDKKNTEIDFFSLILFSVNNFQLVKIEKFKLKLFISEQKNIFIF